MAYEIDKINYLQIGVQGENIARKIEIDMTKWVQELEADNVSGYSFNVIFRPYNDPNKYPMVTTYNSTNKILTWKIGSAATQTPGVGYTEVRAQEATSGLVKKTRIIPTSVEESVSGNETDPPEVQAGWVTNVLNAGTAAVNANTAAQAAKTAAETARDAAQAAAGNFQDLSASVTGLAAGASPTVNVTHSEGGYYNLAFGIPKGDKGDKGDPAPLDNLYQAVDEWLGDNNFTNPDSPPLDRNLASSSSAAPADMVGDLKSVIIYNCTGQGASGATAKNIVINSSGQESASTTRISTGFIQFSEYPVTVTLNSGYSAIVRNYYKDFSFYARDDSWGTSKTLTSSERYYRFVIRKDNGNAITPDELSNAIASGFTNAFCYITDAELRDEIKAVDRNADVDFALNRITALEKIGEVTGNVLTSLYLKTGEKAIIDVSAITGTVNAYTHGHTSSGVLAMTSTGRKVFTASFDGYLEFTCVNTATINAVYYLETDTRDGIASLTWTDASKSTDALEDLELGGMYSNTGSNYDITTSVRTIGYLRQDIIGVSFDNTKYKCALYVYDGGNGKFIGQPDGNGGYTKNWQDAKNVANPVNLLAYNPQEHIFRLQFIKIASGDAVISDVDAKAVTVNTRQFNDGETYTVGTGRQFESFMEMLDALKNNGNKKTVYVYPGEYDIFEEMGGADFIATVDTTKSWEEYNFVVPRNTHIVGIGNVVLKWQPTDSEIIDNAHANIFSPLNVYGSCRIENISIVCSNCRYGIHDETSGAFANNGAVHEYINVNVQYNASTYGNKYAYGAGHNRNMKLYFKDCVFEAAYGDVWSTHDWNAAENESSMFVFDSCVFGRTDNSNKGGVRFSSSDTSGRIDNVRMNNCSLSRISFSSESGTSAIKQGYKVTAIGCNVLGTTIYTDRIAVEDRIPPVEINPIPQLS